MRKKILVSMVWAGMLFYPGILNARPACDHDSFYKSNADRTIQYRIIPSPGNTWGYDILKNHQIFIHQPNRPGMPGNTGFATKQDAAKVAKLVIAKIKKGMMPPTVSQEELKALKLKN